MKTGPERKKEQRYRSPKDDKKEKLAKLTRNVVRNEDYSLLYASNIKSRNKI